MIYLDGQRVQVNLLQSLDLHVLNQATELSDWNPLQKKIYVLKIALALVE